MHFGVPIGPIHVCSLHIAIECFFNVGPFMDNGKNKSRVLTSLLNRFGPNPNRFIALKRFKCSHSNRFQTKACESVFQNGLAKSTCSNRFNWLCESLRFIKTAHAQTVTSVLSTGCCIVNKRILAALSSRRRFVRARRRSLCLRIMLFSINNVVRLLFSAFRCWFPCGSRMCASPIT